MPRQRISIQSIFEGLQPSALFGQAGQYQAAIGIDPDLPMTDGATDTKTGGILRPVVYEEFSTGMISSYPVAIITTPKDTNVYVVLRDGRLFYYNSTLTTETYVGQTTVTTCNGAFYYNNYIYIIGTTNVARFGPLDGSAALTNGVWTGSTLGSQTALTNTTYPTGLLGVSYLNHFGIAHLDGAAYFLDYKAGVGYVHKIATTKSTFEGDTNNGSAYDVLDLPLNYHPITIESFGNDLVVSASLTTNGNIRQGRAALFFFNPSDTTPSFYRKLSLPDAICTVLKYRNGTLTGISGDLGGRGYRVFDYVSGDTIQTQKVIEQGYPPLQGAADLQANRLAWAADTVYPMVGSGLYAFGSKSDLFPRGLHHIAVSPFI